jgi:hypothetical protein
MEEIDNYALLTRENTMRTYGRSRHPEIADAAKQSPNTQPKPNKLEAAANQAFAACEGESRVGHRRVVKQDDGSAARIDVAYPSVRV